MKPGRNAPCSCGTGKKYKHCCLRAREQALEQSGDQVGRRLRRLTDEFRHDIMRFIDRSYGQHAVHEAWMEFSLWEDDEALDETSPHLPVFMSWFFHRWAPDPEQTEVVNAGLHDVAPTAAYLAQNGLRLDPLLREYLESCAAAPFSFYETVDAVPGRSCRLRGVFSGSEHAVTERSASQSLQPSDLLYAQLGRVGETVLLAACSTVAIPPIDEIGLIDLRERIRAQVGSIETQSLHDWDIEIREVYLHTVEALLHPEMPAMANSHGEPLAPQTLDFEVESAAVAFDALKFVALDAETTEAELLAQAERDGDGCLKRVSFPWRRPPARAARTRGVSEIIVRRAPPMAGRSGRATGRVPPHSARALPLR